ncbi:MAG: PQQ-binding-like beta-propeller repeat protein [Planctomycetia bacterium]|nr:PQQ-binding-like beta-propeller repeat protein [Planctomycetia bacterium]
MSRIRILSGDFFFSAMLFGAFASCFFCTLCFLGECVQAQRIRLEEVQVSEEIDDEDAEEMTTAFPPPDRELQKSISDAQKLIEMERYSESLQQIGEILDAESDFLIPLGEGGVFRSMRLEAEQLLEKLPPKAMEVYEIEHGIPARQKLDAAVRAGDAEAIAMIASRYFYTNAGREAALISGLHLLDCGYPLPAAMMFQKLYDNKVAREKFDPLLTLLLATSYLQGGVPDRAEEVLKEANWADAGWKKVEVGGEKLVDVLQKRGARLSADGVCAWLEQTFPEGVKLPEQFRSWLIFRGNWARSGGVRNASLPVLVPCWRLPLIDDSEGMALLYLLREKMAMSNKFFLMRPIVCGDIVLMRTVWNLTAIDLRTGKRLWEVPSADYSEMKSILAANSAKILGNYYMSDGPSINLMAAVLNRRVWGDGPYGDLASDGKLVFCIEDTLDPILNPREPFLIRGGGNAARKKRRGAASEESLAIPNRLAAYDIQTGKLVWHIGGLEARWNLPESGVRFCGAPLPIANELYIMGEQAGGIYLFAIDSTNGSVKWKQQLCVISEKLPPSQTPSFSPVFADGILVCHTPNNCVVALDIASRAILWGNAYAAAREDENRYSDPYGLMYGALPARLVDPTPIIYDKKVLFRTGTGNCCLDLATGKKFPYSGQGFSFCGILDGKLIQITPYEVGVFKFEQDGLSQLRERPSISPRGNGFCTENRIILPIALEDGTEGVGAIRFKNAESAEGGESNNSNNSDNNEGTSEDSAIEIVVEQFVPNREKTDLGDLFPAGDFILSQNGMELTAYIQRDHAEAFVKDLREKDPDSLEATLIEAMIAWEKEDWGRTITLLKQSGDFARPLLRSAILEGVRKDFDFFFGMKDEALALLENPEQNLEFRQFLIHAHMEKKEWIQAARECEALLVYIDALPQKKQPRHDLLFELPKCVASERPVPEAGEGEVKYSLTLWFSFCVEHISRNAEAKNLLLGVMQRRLEALGAKTRAFEEVLRESKTDPSEAEQGTLADSEPNATPEEGDAPSEVIVEAPVYLDGFDLFVKYRELFTMFRIFPEAAVAQEAAESILWKMKFAPLLELNLLAKAKNSDDLPSAAAEIVLMFVRCGEAEKAIPYLEFLHENTPNLPCLEGKTPKQWWQARPEGDKVRLAMERADEWKSGSFVFKEEKETYAEQGIVTSGTSLEPNRGKELTSVPFSRRHFSTNANIIVDRKNAMGRFRTLAGGHALVCEDEWGSLEWTSPHFGSFFEDGFSNSIIDRVGNGYNFFQANMRLLTSVTHSAALWETKIYPGEEKIHPILAPVVENVRKMAIPFFNQFSWDTKAVFRGAGRQHLYLEKVGRGSMISSLDILSGRLEWKEPSSFYEYLGADGRYVYGGVYHEDVPEFYSSTEMDDFSFGKKFYFVEDIPLSDVVQFLETLAEEAEEVEEGGENAQLAEKGASLPEEFREALLKLPNKETLRRINLFRASDGVKEKTFLLPEGVLISQKEGKMLFFFSHLGFALVDFRSEKLVWSYFVIPEEPLDEGAEEYEKLAKEREKRRRQQGRTYLSYSLDEVGKRLYLLNNLCEMETIDFETGKRAKSPVLLPPELSQRLEKCPKIRHLSILEIRLMEDDSFLVVLAKDPEHMEFEAARAAERAQEAEVAEEKDEGDESDESNDADDAEDADEADEADDIDADGSDDELFDVPEEDEAEDFTEDESVHISELYAISSQRALGALVYRLDANLQPMWKEPLYEANGYYMSYIPRKLPIWGFAYRKTFPANRMEDKDVCVVKLYDTRTGDLFFDFIKDENISSVELEGKPLEDTLIVNLGSKTWTFEARDEPYTEGSKPKTVRPDVSEEIRRRKRELENRVRYRNGIQKALDEENQRFEAIKDPTKPQIQEHQERAAGFKKNIQSFDRFIKKEEEEIRVLESSYGLFEGEKEKDGESNAENPGENASGAASVTPKEDAA